MCDNHKKICGITGRLEDINIKFERKNWNIFTPVQLLKFKKYFTQNRKK